MRRNERLGWIALVVVLVAVVAWLAVGSDDAGDDSASRTLKFSEINTRAQLTSSAGGPESALSQGDAIAFRAPLLGAGGASAGSLQWTCTITTGGRNFDASTSICNGVYALRDGTLTIQFNITPSGHRSGVFTGTVTGGTGTYANARGVVVSESSEAGRDDTITLVE